MSNEVTDWQYLAISEAADMLQDLRDEISEYIAENDVVPGTGISIDLSYIISMYLHERVSNGYIMQALEEGKEASDLVSQCSGIATEPYQSIDAAIDVFTATVEHCFHKMLADLTAIVSRDTERYVIHDVIKAIAKESVKAAASV